MAGDMLKALARYGIQAPAIRRQKFHVCCPIHQEKTPSCHIDLNKQVWHCFGCDTGGDAVQLVQLAEKVTYPEALRILGLADQQEAGIHSARNTPAPPPRRADPAPADDAEDRRAMADARRIYDACSLLGDTPAGWYCQSRGIPLAIAAAAGARYHADFLRGGPAAVFPVFDAAGQLTAVQGRYLAPAPKDSKRPDKKTRGRLRGVFLTMAGAITQPGAVIVTEAPLDACSLAAVGFPALALLGTHYPDWLPARIGARPVYLATDNDGAGDGAAKKLCDALAANGGRIFRLKPTRAKDWNEYLCTHGPAVMEAEIIRAAFPTRAPIMAPALIDLAHMLPAGCRVITNSGDPATVTGYTAPCEDLPAGSVQLVTDGGQVWDCDARGLRDAAGVALVPYSLLTWREKIAQAKGKLQTISGLPGV